MSVPNQQEEEEAIEEQRDGFGGSPLHSDVELYFHPPSSPQSWDLCLSPLWNFEEYASRSCFTGNTCGLPVIDIPRSLSWDFESYESPADSKDKRWLSSPLCSLKCRISLAFKYLKESVKQHILVQVWIPVKRENRYWHTISESPWNLECQFHWLFQHRLICMNYNFSADDKNDALGISGRAFRNKFPEWTSDIECYSCKTYPQLNDALQYNIRGTLAVPLFEPGDCWIGILELVMTSQMINYAPEIELLCKALEAVELRSSEIFHLTPKPVYNENQHIALSEILEVLTVASETYRFPLAQTWRFCSHHHFSTHGGSLPPCNSYNRSNTNKVCMSTCDAAFYVVDAHMWGFREACIELHLVDGQGVIGGAFSSLNSCFCRDITQLSEADYPLVHYARMFGLRSCLAVPVGNCKTANDIYILEFFLPPHLTDFESQKKLLAHLFETIRQSFQNLRIVSPKEFGEERDIEIINFPLEEKLVLVPEYYERSQNIKPSEYGHEHNQTLVTLGSTYKPEAAQTEEMVKTKSHEQQKKLEDDSIHGERKIDEGQRNVSVTVPGKEDKRTLEVLQQLYGRSLQDAAEYLDVSRATFKRICRKLGITRWPSHKRKKTSHLNKSVASTSTFRHGFLHHTQPEMLVGRYLSRKSSTAVKDLEPLGVEKQVLDSSRPLPSTNLALHQEKAIANVAIAPRTQTAATAPSERTLSINARYQQKTTKFLLHFPLTMTALEKELAEILNLKLGTFFIKYLDTENDWILMACDDDLQDLTVVSGLTCDGTVQMIVQEVHNL